MWQCLAVFLLSLIILQDFTLSLRLVEVRVPNYIIKGSPAQLECLYELDGEALYSVKWYKDGNEFYRYVPRDIPPAQTFLLPGVSVDVYNSSDAIVTLREVNLQTTGRFRCEVSGEAPAFQTVTEHADMVVVSLPDQGPPKISGGRARYQIGDWVRINCTVGRSKPAVQLSWYVNGEAAEPHMLRKYDTIISGREGLETTVLGLQFRVEQRHFHYGDIKLKCVASLSTFYWRSNEESVEGDRVPNSEVLESRETFHNSNSHADPVQGTSLQENFGNKILSFFIQPKAANKTNSTFSMKSVTLVLLILMAVVNSTGCLEHFYMKTLWKIKNSTIDLQEKAILEKKWKINLIKCKGNISEFKTKTSTSKKFFNKEESTKYLPIILDTTETFCFTCESPSSSHTNTIPMSDSCTSYCCSPASKSLNNKILATRRR